MGDVALLVSALVCIIRLFDSVADHEKRITKLEVSQSAQEARINNNDKNIAILNNAIWPDSERIKNSQ
ncbi:MAG: hypothetical protein KGL39_46730 [Patescibacteria group bacterium]|nr:hypothetical protein [Patescibacteria group bacterium]